MPSPFLARCGDEMVNRPLILCKLIHALFRFGIIPLTQKLPAKFRIPIDLNDDARDWDPGGDHFFVSAFRSRAMHAA